MTFDGFYILDLSHPIAESMPHWPGDPPTKITATHTLAYNGFNLENLDKLGNWNFFLFVGALAIHGGSGSPCRVLALQRQLGKNPVSK